MNDLHRWLDLWTYHILYGTWIALHLGGYAMKMERLNRAKKAFLEEYDRD